MVGDGRCGRLCPLRRGVWRHHLGVPDRFRGPALVRAGTTAPGRPRRPGRSARRCPGVRRRRADVVRERDRDGRDRRPGGRHPPRNTSRTRPGRSAHGVVPVVVGAVRATGRTHPRSPHASRVRAIPRKGPSSHRGAVHAVPRGDRCIGNHGADWGGSHDPGREAAWRDRLAMPVAMAIGSLVFYSVVAFGRAAGFAPKFAEMGRYLHVVAGAAPPGGGCRDGRSSADGASCSYPSPRCTSSRFRPTWRTWKPCKPTFEGTKRDILLIARPPSHRRPAGPLPPLREELHHGRLVARAACRRTDPGPCRTGDRGRRCQHVPRHRAVRARVDQTNSMPTVASARSPSAPPWANHPLQGHALHHDEPSREVASAVHLVRSKAGKRSRLAGRRGRGDDQTRPAQGSCVLIALRYARRITRHPAVLRLRRTRETPGDESHSHRWGCTSRWGPCTPPPRPSPPVRSHHVATGARRSVTR